MIGSWGPGRGRRAEASRPGARDVSRDGSARSVSAESQSRVVLGWAMAAVAAMVLLFLVVPFGWRGSSPTIDPATSTGSGAPPESVTPQTWVLSSTKVTSLPPEDAAVEDDEEKLRGIDPGGTEVGDAEDLVERPAPWIIRVPRATPTAPAARSTIREDDPVSPPPSRSTRPSAPSASPSPAPGTTSVPAPSTTAPGETCPPGAPTETAPPPPADAGNVPGGDPTEGGALAGGAGATSAPAADPGQGATASDPCGG